MPSLKQWGLEDPDVVGSSEYRAIYECIEDALQGYEQDSGLTPAEYVRAIVDEFKGQLRTFEEAVPRD
jgi:hypothetical protein